MIQKIGQVMVYVNNQEASKIFWEEKVGFHVVSEHQEMGMRWIEMAPTADAETSIILHDKQKVAQMDSDLNLGTPSLMFFTKNLDQLYQNFSDKKINVGEIVNTPSRRVFNFSDDEDNYFAVMEHE